MRMTHRSLWWVLLVVTGPLAQSSSRTFSSPRLRRDRGSEKGKDGAPLIVIPAGPFQMGSNEGLPNERPEHTVTLPAYYIDQFEITAGRYQNFFNPQSGTFRQPGMMNRLKPWATFRPWACPGPMPQPIVSGRGDVCRLRRNGRKPREEPTAGGTPGAICNRS